MSQTTLSDDLSSLYVSLAHNRLQEGKRAFMERHEDLMYFHLLNWALYMDLASRTYLCHQRGVCQSHGCGKCPHEKEGLDKD